MRKYFDGRKIKRNKKEKRKNMNDEIKQEKI